MKFKMSNQAIGALMMVFNDGFLKMVAGKDADMTETFAGLEFFVNEEKELVCDNPPITDLSILDEILAEEE